MFVAHSVASLRLRRLLHFFLFTLTKRKITKRTSDCFPFSPRPFSGDNATCLINAVLGHREPEHQSGEKILPTARRAEQVRSTVSWGVLCDRQTVHGELSKHQPFPARGLSVPPLLSAPRSRTPFVMRGRFSAKARYGGCTAPGPVI